ncbi:hypothetical protein Tco_1483358 [Tanacetum coccineum]
MSISSHKHPHHFAAGLHHHEVGGIRCFVDKEGAMILLSEEEAQLGAFCTLLEEPDISFGIFARSAYFVLKDQPLTSVGQESEYLEIAGSEVDTKNTGSDVDGKENVCDGDGIENVGEGIGEVIVKFYE